jgi:uncharacterized membrane protein YgcG
VPPFFTNHAAWCRSSSPSSFTTASLSGAAANFTVLSKTPRSCASMSTPAAMYGLACQSVDQKVVVVAVVVMVKAEVEVEVKEVDGGGGGGGGGGVGSNRHRG